VLLVLRCSDRKSTRDIIRIRILQPTYIDREKAIATPKMVSSEHQETNGTPQESKNMNMRICTDSVGVEISHSLGPESKGAAISSTINNDWGNGRERDGAMSAQTGDSTNAAAEINATSASGGAQEGTIHQQPQMIGTHEDLSGLSLIANASAHASAANLSANTPSSVVTTSYVTPGSGSNTTGTAIRTGSSSPMGSKNAVPASSAAAASPYQSPPADAGHSFMHYPPSASAAPNPNANPHPHDHGNAHANGPDRQQQQWRYYNPRDTPHYPHSHAHGHAHAHGPPPSHTQGPPHAHGGHGHPMNNVPMESPYAMHGPHSHSHPMGPGPLHGNMHMHGHGHDHGHHSHPGGPGPMYYDSYGSGGMPPGGYYSAGPGVGEMANAPPHSGNGNDNGQVPQMHPNSNMDESTPGFPIPASMPNTGASMAGHKRCLDEAMRSDTGAGDMSATPIAGTTNATKALPTPSSRHIEKYQLAATNEQQEARVQAGGTKEIETEAKVLPMIPKSENIAATDSKAEVNTNTNDDVEEKNNSSNRIRNVPAIAESGSASATQGQIPSTPAAAVQMLSGATPGISRGTPGSMPSSSTSTTPMNTHAPNFTGSAGSAHGIKGGTSMPMSSPEMYDPYYSGASGVAPGGPMPGGGHYGHAPARHGHWQHGSGSTPAHSGYSDHSGHPPTPHGPPPQGHGPTHQPGMYYDNMGEMDASAHGYPHGMSSQEYDRGMYYNNSYGAGPGAGAPVGHNGHGHVHPHTPYAPAQTLEQSHKTYVTPEARSHGSPHVHGMGSPSPQMERSPHFGVGMEEGDYTKLLRSKGARLTDRKKLQNKAWFDRFEELKTYKEEHCDCLVPQKYPPSPR